MKVIIYSTPSCTYCHIAKMYFGDHGIDYEDVNVKEDKEAREFMLQSYGSMGVPVIALAEFPKRYMVGWSIEKFDALMAQQVDATDSKLVK